MLRKATIVSCLALCIASAAHAQTSTNHCQVSPNRADAVDFP